MKAKVLCLDDDQPILNRYCTFPWNKYGCELVGIAADGQEGLHLLNEIQPDIILVDIVMPRIDGLDFICKARELLPQAVFIVLSAHCDFEYSRRAMRYGVRDYLIKGEYTESELGELLTVFSNTCLHHKQSQYRFEVSEALRLIRKNLKQEITLESIAQEVGMSPNYLGTLFYQQTGERFRDTLIRLRMERANELIMHSPLKIHEIAQQVGIQNPQYFTYLYQKVYGVTPVQMRKVKK